MAETIEILGQAAPAAATDSTLLTVPVDRAHIISTLTVCNRGTANTTFRVAVIPSGGTLAAQHYLYYDANIGANVTVAVTIGMTLDAGDQVMVRSASGDVSFSAFGTNLDQPASAGTT